MISCPVCTAESAAPFLVREPVSVHQNLLVDTPGAARALNRGRLEMHACPGCGFVFNAAFDPRLLQYGAAYENAQSYSPAFEAHLDGLADHLTNARGLRGIRVVEVGCGKGGFLRALVGRAPDTHGIGFDPSYVGPPADLDGRVRFERRFYDDSCVDLRADAVVCRHVIEHVQDPVGLLRLVRSALRDGQSRVYFETPCVEWILAHEVMWDFFYEHCSYFTAASLSAAFMRAGLTVDSVRHVFGGQYLWIEARAAEPAPPGPADDRRIASLAAAFARAERSRVAALRQQLERLAADGGVALWGAAAKGVTLAGLVDPSASLLSCVVDLNPRKQGRYLPGTGHRIVAPGELPACGVRWAAMTNPNYIAESEQLLREAGIAVRLVDLMEAHQGEIRAP
jgi:SAM-dependent methyltransferase